MNFQQFCHCYGAMILSIFRKDYSALSLKPYWYGTIILESTKKNDSICKAEHSSVVTHLLLCVTSVVPVCLSIAHHTTIGLVIKTMWYYFSSFFIGSERCNLFQLGHLWKIYIPLGFQFQIEIDNFWLCFSTPPPNLPNVCLF